MIYCFDVDGTLCETDGTDYEHAKPIAGRIARVNELAAEGHTIVIYTARGQVRSDKVRRKILKLTKRQLEEWGVQYATLRQKPAADVYVDDRARNADEFFLAEDNAATFRRMASAWREPVPHRCVE